MSALWDTIKRSNSTKTNIVNGGVTITEEIQGTEKRGVPVIPTDATGRVKFKPAAKVEMQPGEAGQLADDAGGPGRPRVYATNAERQAAYRERQKQQQDNNDLV
jgi:hypothetical protein